MRRHPHLFEANARLWLRRMAEKHGRALTLRTVPHEEWEALAGRGFDLVWLMGVWRRSAAARRVALAHDGLRAEFDRALPAWSERDVAGSPFAVHDYALDPHLGNPGDLAPLRGALQRHGLGLVLDFVPNHLALDHPWTRTFPERFVRAEPDAASRHPDWFFSPGGAMHLGHGRDPYFPPWSDTVQVNYRSPGLREALIDVLHGIAGIADGVRCDMAMLALNEVFGRVWGEYLGGEEDRLPEFWHEAIRRVKARHPGFLFIAEAYWGLERQLLELGFDYVYDKSFYDALVHGNPSLLRDRIATGEATQSRCVRFIENHDERRAAEVFGRERSLAAATVLLTTPGMRLLHDGQLEGRSVRTPVQLIRERPEEPDPEVTRVYDRLLAETATPEFHSGRWDPLEVVAHDGAPGAPAGLLAWSWRLDLRTRIIVVNYSGEPTRGRVVLPGDAPALPPDVELEPWGTRMLDHVSSSPSSRSPESSHPLRRK